MSRIPIHMFQVKDNGMIRIPPGHFVVRQNEPQKEYIKQQFPDKPLHHTILVTSGLGDKLPLIEGYSELSKPRCRSLRKYKSDKPGTSRGTSLSVIRTLRKVKAKGKDKGKGKKRPSDKGETRKGKKAKARKKQDTKKRRKTKRRTQKKSNRVV